jgi:hypothetical protein
VLELLVVERREAGCVPGGASFAVIAVITVNAVIAQATTATALGRRAG